MDKLKLFIDGKIAITVYNEEEFNHVVTYLSMNNIFLENGEPANKMRFIGISEIIFLKGNVAYGKPLVEVNEEMQNRCIKYEFVKKEIEDKSRKNGLNSLMTKDDICNKNKFYEEVLEALTGETIQKLDDAYYIDKKVYENVKKDLLEYLNKNKEITVAQFRDITKSNRKISIVMLEHFDRNRITKRVEDKRILY